MGGVSPSIPPMPTRIISSTFKFYMSFNVPKRLSYLLRAEDQGSNEFLITKYLPTAKFDINCRTDAPPVGTWFIWNEALFYVNKKGIWRSFGLGEAHCADSTPVCVEDDPEGDFTDQEEVNADLVGEDDD